MKAIMPRKRKAICDEQDDIFGDILADPALMNFNGLFDTEISEYEKNIQVNVQKNREFLLNLQMDWRETFIPIRMEEFGDTSAVMIKTEKPKKKRSVVVEPCVERRTSLRSKGNQITLFDAISNDDLEQVKDMLNQISDANHITQKQPLAETTILHHACDHGNEIIVQLLLDFLLKKQEFSIEISDNQNRTPLRIAQEKGYSSIVYLLQQHKPAPKIIKQEVKLENHRIPTQVVDRKNKQRTITSRPSKFLVPVVSTNVQEGTCGCCHTCRNSLKIHKKDSVRCSTCHYVYCKPCFGNKIKKYTWEEAKRNENWMCEVCMGTCQCSRCSTRGPPTWYGYMAVKPETNATSVDGNDKGEHAEGKHCVCCHICRRSVVKFEMKHMACNTCWCVVCKDCLGKKVNEKWEDVQYDTNWSCTVCKGTCTCQRCQTRGGQKWYGHLKSKKL